MFDDRMDSQYRARPLEGPVTAGLLRELLADPTIPDDATLAVGKQGTARKAVFQWKTLR